MCGDTYRCWRNWVFKKSSITVWYWRVPHRYWTTTTNRISQKYDISASILTLIIYRQITRTTVNTTGHHSTFTASIAPYPYVVVTKCIWKASISMATWDQNTLHLPNISLASNIAYMCLPGYLLIPACSLSLLHFNDFEARGYNPLTPSWAFHNQGFRTAARDVVDPPPLSPSTTRISGTSILNAEKIMDCYLVFSTLYKCTSSLYDSAVNTISPVTNCK